MIYWNFYLDFGPLNLGQLFRFCIKLNSKLNDEKLKDKVIIFYSGAHGNRKANAIYLICSWLIMFSKITPEEAYAPFKHISLPPWHDATNTICTFKLTMLDTLRGLQKAIAHKFFDVDNFDLAEYEKFEQVENVDLNWLLKDKFIGFAGPHATRQSPEGYRANIPEDYVEYFKKKNVGLVVRLNKKYYDAK